MTGKLYRLIASTLDAYIRCGETDNAEWRANHAEVLCRLELLLPSGSCIDSGTKLDLDRSTPDKLVFETAFHHMNDDGGYVGWTEHTVTATASLAHDLNLKISGPNKNEIKDYLYEVFDHALRQTVALGVETAHIVWKGAEQ